MFVCKHSRIGEGCTETILEGFSDVRRNIGERQCGNMKEGKEKRAGRQEIRWSGGKSERSPETETGESMFQLFPNKQFATNAIRIAMTILPNVTLRHDISIDIWNLVTICNRVFAFIVVSLDLSAPCQTLRSLHTNRACLISATTITCRKSSLIQSHFLHFTDKS